MFSRFLIGIALLFPDTLIAQQLMGFTDNEAAGQIRWEKRYDSLLSTSTMDEWMKFLTSRPHHLGSLKGKENAEYIAERFRSWGYHVAIETFDVLFPTPETRLLHLSGPKPYTAKLEEPELRQDRTSSQKAEQLPSYNAYSADGDVAAPLVFVNRGVPADYEVLKRMGIDVKGKIVIAKYGGSWRGIKPKVAAEHGAIGCIIYSDPYDDGYAKGDVYPEGPYKPAAGVQRGSVLDLPVMPGDPLTPGAASVKGIKRLDRTNATTLMKIPVLPISYEDALPLMRSIGGPVAPASWRGALPITYHVGPGTQKVRLKLKFKWENKTVYNVIAKLKGAEYPDEWIIRGNHHDAWVNGATDPVSGMISEMEEARVIGELVKNGMKLKRTLVYCAWDGEEQGLLGSVEWVEQHRNELQQKAVLYINSDATTRGFINAGGSHVLEPFFNEVSEHVTDPQTGVSVRQRLYARKVTSEPLLDAANNVDRKYIRLGALGAGSDWSGFLQHLGIASINLSYGGEGNGGEYHSIYDSYDHFTRFKDPGFKYCAALAATAGRVSMRMANAAILPFDCASFTETVTGYAEELKKLVDNMRVETETENKLIAENLFQLAADPKENVVLPQPGKGVPYLNFTDLDNALYKLNKESDELKNLMKGSVNLINNEEKERLNSIFSDLESTLLTGKGLPGRPWYRHQVYAPGLYTGYGVKTLPGIREAIEQKKWKEAEENIIIVAGVLDAYRKLVEQAKEVLMKKQD